MSGGLSLTIKGGIESNKAIKDYLYVNANLNVESGAKAVWPYKNDKTKVSCYFYLGNTNLSAEGYVDSWLLGGHRNFNFNYVLLNTEIKSKKSLIFDLKNGEISTIEENN